MFDEEVDGYSTYEEYLDSLVTEEDHHYLEDEEMARYVCVRTINHINHTKVTTLKLFTGVEDTGELFVQDQSLWVRLG